ncbi:hypothetical protein CHARACLAT_003051 [Characodon lateralis]|uniref:Uncharacterized protein n=1 Tax=Characodon lateralis TaxID=208331 RepID=A0ABU7DD88_9TELE|nr:hypothetical protein [Characodon lateralis]
MARRKPVLTESCLQLSTRRAVKECGQVMTPNLTFLGCMHNNMCRKLSLHMTPFHSHGGGSIMLWECFCRAGAEKLIGGDRKMQGIPGRKYVKCFGCTSAPTYLF